MKSRRNWVKIATSMIAIIALSCVLPFNARDLSHGETQSAEKNKMQFVNGIGGVFLYSDDPAKLARWYLDSLGIKTAENKADGNFYCEFVYRQADNPDQKSRTVWAIMRAKEKRGATAPRFQINYRVDDLDAVIKHLNARNIPIEKREDYDYGRFAWATDCDGNRIELFQEKKAL